MSHEEAVLFIQSAITGKEQQNWADLGSGSGTFTKALNALLPAESQITAVDREMQRLELPGVSFVRANFERDDLQLQELDGILIANALHYVAHKTVLIRKLEPLFKDSPRFMVIEYDSERSNPWVPHPISFTKLKALFNSLGYRHVTKVSERPSAYSGKMYCALIEK